MVLEKLMSMLMKLFWVVVYIMLKYLAVEREQYFGFQAVYKWVYE